MLQSRSSHFRSRSPPLLDGRLGSPVFEGRENRDRSWGRDRRRSHGGHPPEGSLRASLGSSEDLRVALGRRAEDDRYDQRGMRIQISLDGQEEARRRIHLEDRRRAPGEDEYDFFVGGLVTRNVRRVEGEDLASLFSRYGRVTKAEPVKTYAFVNLETTEERAMAAVAELSGTFQFENKISVQFRKGSKYEHLNERLNVDRESERRQGRPSVSEDGIVIVGEVGKGVRAAVDSLEEVQGAGEVVQLEPMAGSSGTQRGGPFQDMDKVSLNDEPMSKPYNRENSASGATPNNDVLKSVLESFNPNKPAEPSSADLKLIMETIQSKTRPVDEGPKAQRKIHISGLSSRVDNFDLKDLFGRFGQINRVDSKLTYGTYTRYGFVFIFCSELTAVRCVCELDGHFVKGAKLKVNFMRGSYEDSKEFKEKWSEQIKVFTSREHKQRVEQELQVSSHPVPKMALSEIGSGLSSLDMSLSLEPLHPSFQRTDPFSSLYSDRGPGAEAGGWGLNLPPPIQAFTPAQEEVSFISDVQGTIHSIQNKLVLLEFTSPLTGSACMAKLVPGQMYINGQQSLGYVIKSNAFHTWPKMVKDFLQIGMTVSMDLRRLTEKEQHEGRDKDRAVVWTAPLVWQAGCRPSEADLTLAEDSSETRVSTAVITCLQSSWGLLRHPEGEILFLPEKVFWETAPLGKDVSLATTDLEVGDLVAVHYKHRGEEMSVPEDAPHTSLQALLVWSVGSEVDPWVYHRPPSLDTVKFLATSSTLARQLPGDAEAEHSNIEGEVEEIHLPAGGVIRLTKEAAGSLGLESSPSPAATRVYFHRSRLHINGTKIQSDQGLEQELVLGDRVSLDLVRNRRTPGEEFVRSGAQWVALAVRCHTVARGVGIAARLREERGGGEEMEPCTARARVVWLQGAGELRGPATQGVAVLESGEYMGQRVEFDRSVCGAFGQQLARADLSRVFGPGVRRWLCNCFFLGQWYKISC